MDVNDDAHLLDEPVALKFFASKLAPTVNLAAHTFCVRPPNLRERAGRLSACPGWPYVTGQAQRVNAREPPSTLGAIVQRLLVRSSHDLPGLGIGWNQVLDAQ